FEGRRVTEYTKEHMSFYHVEVKEIYFIYIDDKGNEVKHGLESIYHNGELSFTGIYRNGKRDGDFIQWSSGRKVGESHYKNGVNQGYYKRTDWFIDDVKRWEQEQENGVYTDKYWNRRGELISQGTSRVGEKSVEKWEGTFLRTGKGDEVWIDTYKSGKKVSEQKSSLD
ncbi:MAG TPA: hypothetical protein VGB45_06825, partial [Abditibacterium sp.]